MHIQLATHNHYWFLTLQTKAFLVGPGLSPVWTLTFQALIFYFLTPAPTSQRGLLAAPSHFLAFVLVYALLIPPAIPMPFLYPSPNRPILLNPAWALWNLTLPTSLIAHHSGLLWYIRSGLWLLRQTQMRIYLNQFTQSLEHNLMFFNDCWIISYL